ncbi:caspase family protein [Streptomyces inhibens]|uniref:caspase, EACC1-associated type n=1 Tax=Streptomyces inhibens TaxID=2293571 RepID=UPI003694EAFA
MSERRFPHGPASRAVLIGTSRFSSPDLPGIPSVRENLEALQGALTHPTRGLLAPEHCRKVSDPTDQAAVGAALTWAVREADDLLLVYYAGHGVLDDSGLLHLGLVHTDVEHVGFSALPIDLIKRHVGEARAKSRVLLLDCCFSGRAVSAMAEPTNLAVGQLDLSGTYTLTSTTKTAPAHAPIGATYTAFTGALLDALAAPAALTLDEIYREVDRALHGRGLPRPQRRSAGAAGSLALVRGPVRTGGATPPAPPLPPLPPPPSFPLGPPAPAPRARKGKRVVVIASAVGGALAVLLASSLVKGALGDGGSGGGSGGGKKDAGGRPGTGHSGATTPAASAAPVTSGPTPAGPKPLYRDKHLTWQAPDCTAGSAFQFLDLDQPSVRSGYIDTGMGTDLDYVGCPGPSYGGRAVIWPNNADLQSVQVKIGTAGPGTDTADACRAAADERPVGTHVPAAKITAGTVWCVITTDNQVAKVVFTDVNTSRPQGLGTSARNPTFELSATLWGAP